MPVVTFDELGEALAGAAVVEGEAGLTLLLHAEAGWLHLGEGEAEVLVQVVQLVDEVTHVASQHLQQIHHGRLITVLRRGAGRHAVTAVGRAS